MEKVDILLATYNGEKYLKEQLDSILNQTYSNFRLLISDDMSTDSTKMILTEYEKEDNRVKVFLQKENLGIIGNFEFLLTKVESEYFMFSDQDDIWNRCKVEKSINKIEEENINLVFTNLEVVDKDLNVIYESYWKLKGFENKIKRYKCFEGLYLNNFVTGCTTISRKVLIDKILPLPRTTKYILHDYWLALMVSQYGKVGYIDESLIKYRQHKDNKIGSSKKSDKLETLDEIRSLFITVKKEHFQTFVENQEKFIDKVTQDLNFKSLEYFKKLEKVKYINFKNWGLFFKLYKYEGFSYMIQNFIILNIPILAQLLFFIRRKFVKNKYTNESKKSKEQKVV